MATVKMNFTLQAEIARYFESIEKGHRSRLLNKILRDYLEAKTKAEMAKGFQQEAEDFKDWEALGFETWS